MNEIELSNHGQTLFKPDEQSVLIRVATGNDEFDICHDMKLSHAELNTIEKDIQARLDANTLPHAIAKAFINGVLVQRLICAFLVIITTCHSLDNSFARIRETSRNSRTRIELRVRTSRRNRELDA